MRGVAQALRRPPSSRRRLTDPRGGFHTSASRAAFAWACGKYHVDGVYIILSVHKVAASCLLREPLPAQAWVTLQSVELPRRQDRLPCQARVDVVCKQAAELRVSGAARGGDLRARFAARSTRVLVLGAQEDPQGSLRLAYTPSQPTISGARSGPPCTPPSRGRSRYYPYAKVISSAQSDLRSQMAQALG